MKNAKLLIFALASLISLTANAKPLECSFHHRPEGDPLFDGFPKEMVGMINCPSDKIRVNIIHVARLGSADPAVLLEYFERYEQTVLPDGEKNIVVSEKASDPARKFVEIDTLHTFEKSKHFLFTAPGKDGRAFAFTYTDTEERGAKLRPVLERLHKTFSRPDYIGAIESAIDAPAPSK